MESRLDETEAFVDQQCSTHSHLDGQCVCARLLFSVDAPAWNPAE